ncbi:MAG: ABC transporter permease subunit [Chloroherpetonaceae bacterium]|nr:ABC transporter permease subunit [Chloroherpetonaceae bacterium]MCS7210736.1 ABC transporter permease subunit [Chloroherpetonaceae bacterium]MDW8019367.1 ABC transporter permease subunit [Chloroherpetonaceae bacterium]
MTRLAILLLNLLIFFVLIGYVLNPLLQTLNSGFYDAQGQYTFQNYVSLVERPERLRAFANTILLSLLTVLGAGLFGTTLAYTFWRFDVPLRGLLSRLVLLPLGLPPLVGVFSFQFLYGESGVLSRLLQGLFKLPAPPFSFEGLWAVWLVHLYSFYVQFYLFVSAALARIDTAVLEAAENLGASAWSRVWKILLPLLRPSLLSAALIVFVLSMTSFTAPLLFGGKTAFLTVEIFNQKISGEFGVASAMTVELVALSVTAVFLFEVCNAQMRLTVRSRGAPRELPLERLPLPLFLLFMLQVLFIALPIFALVLMSFAKDPLASTSILPTQYSLEHYYRLLSDAAVYRPFLNSLSMAVLASVPNLVFGLVAGLLIAQRRIFLREVMLALLLLPLAIPGTALAINLIAAFAKPSIFAFGTVLVGSSMLLPLAYFIRHLPYITRSVAATLETFDYQLVEAAATLGSPYLRIIGRVIAPLILSSLASGFLFTFIGAISEFPCSILLYTPDNLPIAVDIFSQLRIGSFGLAAAEGVLLITLIFALTWAFNRLFQTRAAETPLQL